MIYIQGKPVNAPPAESLSWLPKNTNAFGVLAIERVVPDSKTPPRKRGPRPNKPKAQQAAMALETPEERKARQTAIVLRKNKYSDCARATDADKTGRIVGRRNAARSQ